MRESVVRKYADQYALGVKDARNSLEQYNSFLHNAGIASSVEDLVRGALTRKPLVRVMDVGCGNGGFLRDLKTVFGKQVQTVGVDLVNPEFEPDEMRVGDALALEFSSDYDLIFSFRSLHEIGEPELITLKIYFALGKGGKAFLSFRTADFLSGSVGLAEITEHEISFLQRLAREKKLAGFSVNVKEVFFPQQPDSGKKTMAGVNVFLEKP
ncbi:MAG: class I SAM-dependent methyltransferase [Candidatus Diapherotrites archaeon]|nr:class I SAM-dependent methyltransferase [Candidatus Diapherotrites archaeon]